LVERLGFIEAMYRFIATALPAIAAGLRRIKDWDRGNTVDGRMR